MQGYFDGELDLVRSLEFEGHLKLCPDCAGELTQQQIMRKMMKAANLYEAAPRNLETRVLAALPRGAELESFPHRRSSSTRWLAFAVAIACAIVLTAALAWNMNTNRQYAMAQNSLAYEVASDHIRSLQPGHLYDVQSTDRHTVKPWFDGKLDFAPPVVDLADHGFPLVGGRLDYLNHRNVAALVYQRQKHYINLFVWPRPSGEPRLPGNQSVQGYNLIFFQRDGMDLCASSDLNSNELSQFVTLFTGANQTVTSISR